MARGNSGGRLGELSPASSSMPTSSSASMQLQQQHSTTPLQQKLIPQNHRQRSNSRHRQHAKGRASRTNKENVSTIDSQGDEFSRGRGGSGGKEAMRSRGVHNDRIARLSQRLHGLQAGIESERAARFEHVFAKLQQLDEELVVSQASTTSTLAEIKDEIVGLNSEIEGQRNQREAFEAEGQREIHCFEQRLSEVLEEEQKGRRKAEARLLQSFEERTKALEQDILHESQTRQSQAETIQRFIEVDLAKLHESLKNETLHRDDFEMRMMKNATQEISRLEGCLAAEKRTREVFEEEMVKSVDAMVEGLQRQLQTESATRDSTHTTLLSLVEDACAKLDSACQL